MLVWRMRQEAARDPNLALVPIPLPETLISTIPGTTVEFFGYEFEVPWQGQVNVKNPGDFIAVAYSASVGYSLGFFNPAKNGPLKVLRKDLEERGKNENIAEEMLGAQSDYDLERSILNATPSQLSLFFPRRKEVYAAVRLMIKPATAVGAETGLYSFKNGQLRGFQFGDPSRAQNIRIEAFDDEDRKFEFVFGSKPGSSFTLKQVEINRVLQTLRPAPASQQ